MTIIYKITNRLTQKSYVGQTEQSLIARFNGHKRCAERKVNRYLYDAMNHYGFENFTIEEIEQTDYILRNEREIFWIKQLNTLIPNGYNMTDGGGGGNTIKNFSPERLKEYKLNLSKALKGHFMPESAKRKISEKKSGSVLSEFVKEQISKTLKQKYQNGEIIAIVPPPKFGKDNWNHVEVDIEQVKFLIKEGKTLREIGLMFKTKGSTVGQKLKEQTGKTYSEWSKEYNANRKINYPTKRKSRNLARYNISSRS